MTAEQSKHNCARPDTRRSPGRLGYVSLETPREGQASRTHIDEVIAGLGQHGWQCTLFTSAAGGASSHATLFARLAGYVAVSVRTARALPKLDALYVRSHFAAGPLTWLAHRLRKPVYQEVNGKPDDLAVTYPFLRHAVGVIHWLYRRQYRRATHLFAVTDGIAIWLAKDCGHSRITVVPNGANTDLFNPEGPVGTIPGPYVIFVGGLVKWHGIETMLAALAHADWPKGVRLLVVGDGVERARLEMAHGVTGLQWLGRKEYVDIPPLLRGAIAALCVIEGHGARFDIGVAPLKLYEALACGTPVIASDLPFQAALIREQRCGYVIPPADPGALARAVAEIVEDRDDARSRGAAGARYVRNHASWQHRAAQVSEIMSASAQRQ